MSSDLLPPCALGFAAKFDAWRPDQLIAIDKTVHSTKRFIAATAPTGFGKTLYGTAVAVLHPDIKRAIYLTSNRGLQDQLGTDLRGLGLVDLRGQRNYPCIALGASGALRKYRRHRGYIGCDEGPCHAGVGCTAAPDRSAPYLRPGCEYYGQVWDATNATLVSSNYAYWLTASQYSKGIGDFDLLILDEAHHAADELENFLTFEINIEDAGNMQTRLLDSDEISVWCEWADRHYSTLNSRIEARGEIPASSPEEVQELRALKGVAMKLKRLRAIDAADWVLERDRALAKFSPIRISRYAEESLFRGIGKVLLMSATLTKKSLTMLGIDEQHMERMEFKSSFPVARRPVIAVETTPEVRVTAHMHDSTKHMWMRRIDRLIESRRDRKGIIHTVSYARMKEILRDSEHKDLMLTHTSGDVSLAVQAFKAHEGPCILVSPSIVTGFDFPGDQCRYQIIGKVPIPDTRGPIWEARMKADKDLPWYLAMQKLVQAVGRSTRSASDWSEVLIVDDSFGVWFLNRARKHAPQWFLESIQFVDMLPQPLEFPDVIAA